MSIKLNYKNLGLREHELEFTRPLAECAFKTLTDRSGAGHEMLGWHDLPHTYDKEEFARIKAAAKRTCTLVFLQQLAQPSNAVSL